MYEAPDGSFWASTRDYHRYQKRLAEAELRRAIDTLPVIQGFSRYAISEDGRIFNRGRAAEVRPTFIGGKGRVSLIDDSGRQCTRSLARLVAIHYVPLPQDSTEYQDAVLKDGDPTNVHVSNIEWRPRWKQRARQENYEMDI